jgi:deoxyribonuclease V
MSKITHSWDLSPSEAIALQRKLRQKVLLFDQFSPPKRVAGVDVGFEQNGKIARAAIAVLELPGLAPVEEAIARVPSRFPYIPGLLSFREIPAILKAFEQIKQVPELLLCDGQGYAHPRRFGLACHLGLLLDIPTIGVAKSRLIGRHEALPVEKGAWVPLIDKEETIGAVLRTRTGVNPLYISTGHRVSLESAIHYVLAATTRFKLPETTRAAHRLASG